MDTCCKFENSNNISVFSKVKNVHCLVTIGENISIHFWNLNWANIYLLYKIQ